MSTSELGAVVRMTRKVTFSSGHRYWIPALSEQENRELFGRWASPFNHGHNYVLDVSVSGQVNAANGMVVNIKRVDDILKAVILAQFDGKSINDEIAHFQSRASSLENLLGFIADEITQPLSELGVHLDHLRLEEMPLLFGELDLNRKTMTLTRVFEFAASHRLHAPALSEAENLRLFGKCNNPAGHGHNYLLEVTVSGQPDPLTGMLIDLGSLDEVVKSEVVDRYDHRNLNVDMPEFADRPTTSEIVALEIFDRLSAAFSAKLPGAELARVRLHETARNIFEVSAN